MAFRPTLIIALIWIIAIPASALVVLGYLDPGSPAGRTAGAVIAPSLLGMIIGGTFLLLLILAAFAGMRPIVFDTEAGWFWRGWPSPASTKPGLTSTDAVRLSRIRALQVLSKRVENKDDDSHYHFYELNLVLHDGRRLHVLGHGGMAAMRDDAKALSGFLGKLIWEKVAL
jgi:hypothetical protein